MTPVTPRHHDMLSRRHLIAAASGAALLSAGPRVAARQDATPASDTDWTFTDDLGRTVALDAAPQRILAYINYAAALWDLGIHVPLIYGMTTTPDGAPGTGLGSINLDEVEVISENYGEFDIEQLVTLNPELIIDETYLGEIDFWGQPAEQLAMIEGISPILNMQYAGAPVTESIARFEELAASLGANLDDPAIKTAQEDFAQASATLEVAIASKPNLSVLFMFTSEAEVMISSVVSSDLIYFRELGLDIVEPTGTLDFGWELLSWEEVARYPADLIMLNPYSLPAETLATMPVWTSLPAVQAGQVGLWQNDYVPSAAQYAVILNDLAAIIRDARDDVV